MRLNVIDNADIEIPVTPYRHNGVVYAYYVDCGRRLGLALGRKHLPEYGVA
jgi:hypothetical protein